MAKRLAMAATTMMTMMATTAAPAPARSLLDTFHQLRSTVRQLGGKAPQTTGVTGSAQAPDGKSTGVATTASGDAEAMVPASVLVDDASDSALERTTTTPSRIGTFDIRDLRLGMSPRESGRVAGRQNFRRRWNSHARPRSRRRLVGAAQRRADPHGLPVLRFGPTAL